MSEQTQIPAKDWTLGPCFWCDEPAVHMNQVGAAVPARTCERHYQEIVRPSLDAKDEARAKARKRPR